jgi:hypothetical protein
MVQGGREVLQESCLRSIDGDTAWRDKSNTLPRFLSRFNPAGRGDEEAGQQSGREFGRPE